MVIQYQYLDHTVACYLTDYAMGFLMLLVASVGYCSLKSAKEKTIMIRKVCIWSVICLSAYALCSGATHHLFKDNIDAQFFDTIWTLGIVAGGICFQLIVIASQITLNTSIWIIYEEAMMLLFIIAIVTKYYPCELFSLLTLSSFLGFLFISINFTKYFLICNKNKNGKYQMKVFTMQIIGLALAVLGTAVQIFKIDFGQEYMNQNAVYHVMATVAVGIVYWTVMFGIEYD